MSRKITKHTSSEPLKVSTEAVEALSGYLCNEITNSMAVRKPMEALWRELMRQYDGMPSQPVKNYPIENAPNTEVTIGAIAADSIYAMTRDLIWVQTTPLATVRLSGKADPEMERSCKALERFANHIVTFEADTKNADEDAGLDSVQLGTGVFYIPWVEWTRKTKTAHITNSGPHVKAIPVEDCLVPGGSYPDIEQMPWIALRFWLLRPDLEETAKRNGWNLDSIRPGPVTEWVRHRRETLGRQPKDVEKLGKMYDIYDIYCYFDIDGDGEREDLYVAFNYTGRTILKVSYNPFDCRPIIPFRYHKRPHLFEGIGVLEMMRSYENEVTLIHNERNANMILANSRHWVGREGAIPGNMVIRPNMITTVPNPDLDLKELKMSDVYPSSYQAEMMTMMLAERRVGINEMSNPRQSSIMGSRTPGITALSLLQQVNRRFTPAFEARREALGEVVRQCLIRYQERLLAGDYEAAAHIDRIMGIEDGDRVRRVLMDEKFDESYSLEITASSASINKEADRQSAVMLLNVLSSYYERLISLVMLAANPQTPPAIKEVAQKVASKATEIIERTIRTFDNIRDPRTFIVEAEEIFSTIETVSPDLLSGLLGAGQPVQPGSAPSEMPLEFPGMGIGD